MAQVQVVDTEEGFRALRESWRQLVCASRQTSYALTWEYNDVSWRHFSSGRALYVLTARDDGGDVVGILPLAVSERSSGPFAIRRLEFLSRSEHPEHFAPYDGENLDILAHPDFRGSVASAFIQQLKQDRSRWDVADLGWLSAGSRLAAYFDNASQFSITQRSPGYITTLPGDWAAYEQDVLGKSESKRISRHGRRLERDYPGDVDYHLITDREEIGPAMDHLIEMNRRRWTSVGQATVFDDDRFVRFHREFVQDAFDNDMVRLYQLRVGGHVLAATCGVVLHDSYHLFQKGFDPEWSKYGPGAVLQAFELRKAIEEGYRVYDWAHGARESKIMWIDDTREDVKVISPTSWKGALYVGKEVGLSSGKALTALLLPDSAYQRLKHAARRVRQR